MSVLEPEQEHHGESRRLGAVSKEHDRFERIERERDDAAGDEEECGHEESGAGVGVRRWLDETQAREGHGRVREDESW